MHPPRTFTYLPEHLWALGTDRSFGWEADGFEYMKISALLWLAGVARGWVAVQTRAQHALEITDPRRGMNASGTFSVIRYICPIILTTRAFMVALLPGGSEGMTEEEDVRVELYINGPLPTSFLHTLGRMMCVRRKSAQSEFVPTLAIPPPGAEEPGEPRNHSFAECISRLDNVAHPCAELLSKVYQYMLRSCSKRVS